MSGALASRRAVLTGVLAGLAASGCGREGAEPLRRLDLPFAFGAYVDPPRYVEEERIAAFLGFERALRRRLDLYHSYHPWEQEFPSAADRYFARRGTRLLLSWGGTDTLQIVSGEHDALVRARALALRDLDRPVLLQWRWEMNRPNLADEVRSGPDYVRAWRHLRQVFAEVGTPQVRWAWCPLVDEAADPDLSAYYPGDDHVDLVGANGYARQPGQSFADVFAPFFSWSTGLDRPVLIGEFGWSAGLGTAGAQARWLREAGQFLAKADQIEAVCYFNNARGASGNYDIEGRPEALEAIREWPR